MCPKLPAKRRHSRKSVRYSFPNSYTMTVQLTFELKSQLHVPILNAETTKNSKIQYMQIRRHNIWYPTNPRWQRIFKIRFVTTFKHEQRGKKPVPANSSPNVAPSLHVPSGILRTMSCILNSMSSSINKSSRPGNRSSDSCTFCWWICSDVSANGFVFDSQTQERSILSKEPWILSKEPYILSKNYVSRCFCVSHRE